MTEEDKKQANVGVQTPIMTLGGNILIMTDPSSELHRLELTLRNMTVDQSGKYVPIGGKEWKPLLNEEGIRSCLGNVEPIVTRNTIMGHISDEEIGNIMMGLSDTIIIDLMVNAKQYQIVNIATRTKILHACETLAFLTLKRAESGGERRFLKGTQQEVTYRTEQNIQKKGIFARLRGA